MEKAATNKNSILIWLNKVINSNEIRYPNRYWNEAKKSTKKAET